MAGEMCKNTPTTNMMKVPRLMSFFIVRGIRGSGWFDIGNRLDAPFFVVFLGLQENTIKTSKRSLGDLTSLWVCAMQ